MVLKITEILKKRVQQNSLKQDAWVAFFLGVSVFLMLAIFQPFGTYNFNDPRKIMLLSGYGFVIGFGYFIAARGLPLIFSNFYKKENWVFGKELINFFLTFFLIISATYFYRNIALGFNSGWYDFFIYTGMAMSVAIFPLGIIAVIRYMKVKNEPIVIYQKVAEVQQNIFISVEGENKNEKIKFAKEELVFIKASDNYVVIHLNKNGKFSKHILRSSLSKLAEQIDDADVLQVHRSYLVNLENVKSLAGKSPNYILELKDLEEPIPISRSKVKSIRAKLQEKPI